jgi:hypothetical protein
VHAARPETRLHPLDQPTIDMLLKASVHVEAMIGPVPIMRAQGSAADDHRFNEDASGERWLAFPEADDIVFWQPEERLFATEAGRAFALGETWIDDATTCAFDGRLHVFADPLSWLRARRKGIVMLPFRWGQAFDRLRDVPRIAIPASLLPTYRRHMKPARLPELFVLEDEGVCS